ncbi:pirin family protein [Nostoc sp.]|uniref:pirin family protein n=1 Tax=Nostoc sp. TaxID=1180 RepID=UPI002FF64DED
MEKSFIAPLDRKDEKISENTISNDSSRKIIHRTKGHRSGPITRLVSPSDVGELIKPFVFLDYFEVQPMNGATFEWHPHSGIATITYMLFGEGHYQDSTGKQGILPQGGVEWMRAGSGVWHTSSITDSLNQGFQLWITLPPEQELAPAESVYLPPHEVASEGQVQVLLGQYGTAKSPIASPPSINYLAVRLKAGERWQFQPGQGHTVCWIAIQAGALRVDQQILDAGELVVFEESDVAINFQAEGDTTFVLGSGMKHPHSQVLGSYSVHTTKEALRQGEMGIKNIAQRLRSAGQFRLVLYSAIAPLKTFCTRLDEAITFLRFRIETEQFLKNDQQSRT